MLTSQLTGTSTTATATAQLVNANINGTATTVLAVQVLGAPATDTLTVTLGGVAVGQITTDASGNGTLVLSSNPQGQQQPLPANFPTSVPGGTAISITDASSLDLTGTLTPPPKPITPPPPTSQPPSPDGVVLTAKLSSTASSATSVVQFTQDSLNGSSYILLCVQVSGAPASDTLSITLGGVVIGQLTTDANGNGKLVLSSNPQGSQQALPANFPAGVASGDAVSVTDAASLDLTGTLQAPTPAALGTLLTAQLTGTGTSATANVQYAQSTANGTSNTVFAVQIQGATANDALTIQLAGVTIGGVTTDANGNALLVLSSNPQGNQQALPADFPTGISAGATVSVTDDLSFSLTGSLATPPKPTQPPPPPTAPVANGTVLTAQLSGSGTSATSNVQFTQDTLNGTTFTVFCVQVQGAPANDTLTVTLAGVQVGQITTDANGNGTLSLSSNPQGNQQALPTNFPTSVASGTAVSVADASSLNLTGTLAAPTAAAPAPWHNTDDPLDVIGNGGAIVPLDALLVINYLNLHGSGSLPSEQPVGSYDLDVSGDNSIAPIDALKIINYLNTHSSGGNPDSSSSSSSTDAEGVATTSTIVVNTATPQAAATNSSASSTAPQLAIGAGLNTSGTSASALSVPSSSTATSTPTTSPTSSSTGSGSSTKSTSSVKAIGATTTLSGSTVDAALSDADFDYV